MIKSQRSNLGSYWASLVLTNLRYSKDIGQSFVTYPSHSTPIQESDDQPNGVKALFEA